MHFIGCFKVLPLTSKKTGDARLMWRFGGGGLGPEACSSG